MSATSNQQDLSDRSVENPQRRHQLKKRNPATWHLRKPTQGPMRLAIKNHFIAMTGEYVGTVLFMIFALGGTNVANIPSTSVTGATQSGQSGTQASTANTSNLLYIALSFGFSLAVNAWIFFRVSGGLFNPAVSLGMVLVGALTPLRGALLTVSQILGGITGAAIIQAITPGTLNVRTTLSAGTSVPQGLFIEMFLTSLLMLAILLLAAEKHKATFIAPIGIGLALFVAELLGVYYTGGSLNPARSFGPAVVLRSFSSYHWIYWLGPVLGAVIAAGFYKMLKWLQYETVLGPETDDDHPARVQGEKNELNSVPGGIAGMDEERAIQGRNNEKQPSYEVSGPGLADLLTEGNHKAVFDLEKTPGPVEVRLQRMEAMIATLLANSEAGGAGQRISTSTYVESPSLRPKQSREFASDPPFGNTSASSGAYDAPFGNSGNDAAFNSTTGGSTSGAPFANTGGRSGSRVQGTTADGETVLSGQNATNAHTHAHPSYVPDVAGAMGRPHVDAKTTR